MPEYQVELWDGKDRAAWDEYVLGHRHGRFCHLSGWKTVVEEAYGQPTYFWVCREKDGRIAGILPTVHLKHFLFGNVLVSMPYLDGGGILADGQAVQKKLLDAALQFVTSAKIPQLELRYANESSPAEISSGQDSSDAKFRMVLPLTENSTLLFGSLKSKIRSQIRRPMKEGARFEIGGVEKIGEFYQIFSINMRDLGSPVHSQIFFQQIARTFPDYLRIGIVYFDSQPAAAGLIFCFKDIVGISWASAIRSYNHLSPNMLLYWEFLKYASDGGYRFFDFGRSSKNSGTYRFKEQWGATPIPLTWRYFPPESKNVGSQIREEFSGFVRIWQKLPVSVANTFGPLIRKYISL